MKSGFSIMKLLAVLALVFGLLCLLAAVVPDQPNDPQRGVAIRLTIVLVGIMFVIVGLVGMAIPVYNRLVEGRNRCQMGMSNIDVLLKRRHDLIDNLVTIAERYAKHENATLTSVAAYRGRGTPVTMSEKTTELEKTFAPSFVAIAEAYPELRADQTFARLFEELRDTEDKIAAARVEYNNAVLSQNNRIGSFPDMILARCCHFREQTFFKLQEGDAVNPAVGNRNT
jgi:LemA protein